MKKKKYSIHVKGNILGSTGAIIKAAYCGNIPISLHFQSHRALLDEFVD
jgi:hypothetical protein